MAARKGNGRQAVRNSKDGFPGWGYAIIGILIGALLMAIYMHRSLLPIAPPGPQPNAAATVASGGDSGLAPATASTAPKKPQYDFYSVLPEKDVRIPDEQLSAMAKAEQQQKAAATATPAASGTTSAPVAHAPATPGVAQETVTAAPAQAVAPTTASAANAGGGYLLQVGAFPNPAQAESMKAQLAMQGFVANVQQVSINGQTYHRVRLGPFHTATALEATKQRLSAAGINAIALKEGN